MINVNRIRGVLPALVATTVLISAPAISQTSGFTQQSQPPMGVTPGLSPGAQPGPATVPNSNRVPTGTQATTGLRVFSTPEAVAGQWRASDLIGQTIYNRANEPVGEVEELVVERDGRVSVAIIGVGGLLGMGERLVAINYGAFETVSDTNTKSVRLVLDVDSKSLRDAPEFRRPDNWRRN